jgi:hypothetical protein
MTITEARPTINEPSVPTETDAAVVPWWRRRLAMAAASIALLGAGTLMASEMVQTACDQRDYAAPGGHASPAPLCETNTSIRDAVEQKSLDIRFAVIDAAFDPLFEG